MQLSAELLRQIVETPADSPPVSGSPEQRKTPRQPLDVQATLLPFSDQFALAPFDVVLRDISRGGFGFLHHRPVPLGEHFGLVVPQSSDRPVIILCTIAYWQPVAPNVFAVGARFCRVLRSADTSLGLVFSDALTGELTDARQAS